jgi:hypothetical protein
VSGGTENGCAFLRDGYCSDGFFEAGVGVRIGRRTRLYRRGDREIEGYVELLGEISGCEKGELCGGAETSGSASLSVSYSDSSSSSIEIAGGEAAVE